jgi:hypothetical protein
VNPPPAPAERFALIIEALCQALARRGGVRRGAFGGLPGPLLILIWTRLRRLAARFNTLARPACPAPSRNPTPRPARTRPNAPCPLPRGFAWLLRLVPESACGGAGLRSFLAEPETLALLETRPELGRVLRPLCRMLGLRLPAILRLPARRPSRAATPDPIHNPPPPRLKAPRLPPAPALPPLEFSVT